MTEIILTCCDYCNRECNEHPQGGRGVIVASTEQRCIEEFGWVLTPKGIKCLDCQEEEQIMPKKRRSKWHQPRKGEIT